MALWWRTQAPVGPTHSSASELNPPAGARGVPRPRDGAPGGPVWGCLHSKPTGHTLLITIRYQRVNCF